MTDKEKYDKYAEELAQRFDDFTRWAKENWPNKSFPLMDSDFSQSRKEIGEILGPKLSEGEATSPPVSDDDSSQYVDMNPAPWP